MAIGRAWLNGWRIFPPVILVNAAVQALFVQSDPVPQLSTGFVLLLAGSLLAVVVSVSVATCGAAAVTHGEADDPGGWVHRGLVVAGWVVGLVVVVVACSLLTVWAAPVVLLLALFVLPAAAKSGNTVRMAYQSLVRHPRGSVFIILVALVVFAASWLAALLIGFFVTGTLGAAITWVWVGLSATMLLCAVSSLSTSPGPARSTAAAGS